MQHERIYVHEKSENMLREKKYKSYHYCCNVMENVWKATNDFFLLFFHDYIFIIFLGREIARKRGNRNFERWEWNVGQLRVLLSSEFCKLLSIAHKWEDSNFSRERKSSLASHWKKKKFFGYEQKILFGTQNKNLYFFGSLSHVTLSFLQQCFYVHIRMNEKKTAIQHSSVEKAISCFYFL